MGSKIDGQLSTVKFIEMQRLDEGHIALNMLREFQIDIHVHLLWITGKLLIHIWEEHCNTIDNSKMFIKTDHTRTFNNRIMSLSYDKMYNNSTPDNKTENPNTHRNAVRLHSQKKSWV